MLAHTFNPRILEIEAEGSLLVQGHHGLYKIESVSKRNRTFTGAHRNFNPCTSEVETVVKQLGKERI